MEMKVENDKIEEEYLNEACSEEVEENLREELHYAYMRIERLKKKVTNHKANAQEVPKALEKSNQMIKDLKVQLEEEKQVE